MSTSLVVRARCLAPLLLAALGSAQAEDPVLTLQDHRFTPTELVVPADTRVKLLVKNLDDTAAEFESTDLNREKVVNGKKEITVFIGPLSPGKYVFYDEFHKDTATGTIIVK
jgi:hypothetical protein